MTEGVYVCSLSSTPDVVVPPRTWTLARFSYDLAQESYDRWHMHRTQQKDGFLSHFPDEHSALIWPHVSGWGELHGQVTLSAGDYQQVMTDFSRDPLGVNDNTGNTDWGLSYGQQNFTFCHGIFVDDQVPIGMRVYHNGTHDVKILYAQFKLVIHPVIHPA